MKKLTTTTKTPRGFTLFIALILTSVILSVGLALLDVAYKQVTLAATSKNSVLAFYNADAGLECALYWDSLGAFDYYNPLSPHQITCDSSLDGSGHPVANTFNFNPDDTGTMVGTDSYRVRTFMVPCPGDPTPGNPTNPSNREGSAYVQIFKRADGATLIYSNGYDMCSQADKRRVERGLKASY